MIAKENAEVWKDIPHYEGLYQVSNFGRVWSIKRQCYMKSNLDRYGYERMTLYKNGKKTYESVHRLVALAFCNKPEGCNVVNHLDENKLNNNANNLEWTTNKDNLNYGTRNKRIGEAMKIARSEKYWNIYGGK